MNTPSISLIIGAYNGIHKLHYMFHNLIFQTFREFEIIIADDGSSEDYESFVSAYKSKFKYPVKYVWHSDEGFRKTRIWNRAIYRSSADTLVFMDMDCIPHPKFVENHHKLSGKNSVITGRRVNIDEDIISIKDTGKPLCFSFMQLLKLKRQKKIAYPECGLYLPFRMPFKKKNATLLGCNMSVTKKNLERINGFDEQYKYSGVGEDTDIEVRFKMIGMEIVNHKNLLVEYHINHPANKYTAASEINFRILADTKKNQKYCCDQGLTQINENDHIYKQF